MTQAGFVIEAVVESCFNLRYASGSAMLDHPFIRLAFRSGWREIVPPAEAAEIFVLLETRLNRLAQQEGMLSLSIPYLTVDCRKP